MSGTAVLAQEEAAKPDVGLADIVVTTQKREQRFQEVPDSITALSSATLEANRVKNVGGLNAIAPNVTARGSSGGSPDW